MGHYFLYWDRQNYPKYGKICIQHMLNAHLMYSISSFFHFSLNKKSNNMHFLQEFIQKSSFFLEYLTLLFSHAEVETIVTHAEIVTHAKIVTRGPGGLK